MYTNKHFTYVTHRDRETAELSEKLCELIIKHVGIKPNITFLHVFWKGIASHWEIRINVNEINYIHQDISLYFLKQYIIGLTQFECLINKIKNYETTNRK